MSGADPVGGLPHKVGIAVVTLQQPAQKVFGVLAVVAAPLVGVDKPPEDEEVGPAQSMDRLLPGPGTRTCPQELESFVCHPVNVGRWAGMNGAIHSVSE